MSRHSPYNYAFDNPIRFIDPDGMAPDDWIRNNMTGKYEDRKEVTSIANTPGGYTYVGKDGQSIIKDLGMNQNYPQFKDSWTGAVQGDYDENMQSQMAAVFNVNAKLSMSVQINADILYPDGLFSNTPAVFKGVSIFIGNSVQNTGDASLVSLEFTGKASITYNSKTYSTNFSEPSGNDQLKATGSSPTVGNIFIPANDLKRDANSSPAIKVSGQFMNGKETMGYPGIAFVIPKKIDFTIAPKLNLPYVK